MALADLNVRLGLLTQNFEKELKGVNRSLRKFQRSTEMVGKSLTTSLTLPIAALGAGATKVFADFELSMAKVQAVSGATGIAFEELQRNALALGRTTQFTASQVSQLQLNLSKLGFSPTEINQSTQAILDLALATGEDLANSATTAAATLRGFGLAATEMTRVTDVMADSFSSTALDLGKFQTAMAVVAPVANVAGATIEQTTALLGALVNRGVDAATAGTSLRNIFLDIANEGLTLGEALDIVRNSTNPLATSMELFGKRGATVATIIANNREEITQLTADFQDSEGEARKMAEIMENTLSGSLNKLKSALEGAGISIGGILGPAISKLADGMNAAVTRFNELDAGTKKVIVSVAGFAAALGPALLIIAKIISIRIGVNNALLLMNNAFKSLAGSALSAGNNIKNLNFKAFLTPQLIAVTAAVTAAVIIWKEFERRIRLANAASKALADINAQVAGEVEAETARTKVLVGIIESENTSREAKINALNKLKEINPQYFGQLDTENIKINEVKQAYDRYNKSLELNARARAAASKLQEIAKRQIDLELENQRIREKGAGQESRFNIHAAVGFQQIERQLSRNNEELQSAQKEFNAVFNIVESNVKALNDFETSMGNAAAGTKMAEEDIVESFNNIAAAQEGLKGVGGASIISDVILDIPDSDVFGEIEKQLKTSNIISAVFGGGESVLDRQTEAMRKYSDGLTLATDRARLFGSEGADLIKAKLDFTRSAIDQATASTSLYSPEVAALREQYVLLNTELDNFNMKQDETNEKLENQRALIQGVAVSFLNSIEQSITGAQSFGEAVKAAFLAPIDAVIKLGVAQAIQKVLGGPAGFLGVFALPIAAAAGAAASALFRRLVGAAGLAHGGIVPPGFPNDSFPALLSSGEAVIPLDQLSSLGLTGDQTGFIAETRIDGQDLVVMLRRAENNLDRFG